MSGMSGSGTPGVADAGRVGQAMQNTSAAPSPSTHPQLTACILSPRCRAPRLWCPRLPPLRGRQPVQEGRPPRAAERRRWRKQ